jgi:small multidrug resistance pump
MNWALIVFGIFSNAMASTLAKSAGMPVDGVAAGLINWRLLMSIGFYGLAFLAYATAVRRLPLNVAHPISTAGAIILVGAISYFQFHEEFSPLRILGYALLLLGIIALAGSGMTEVK